MELKLKKINLQKTKIKKYYLTEKKYIYLTFNIILNFIQVL